MESWVGSQVDGMKMAVLLFLTQPEPTFWPQKDLNVDSLNRILIFNPLKRHYYYQVCDVNTDLLK